MYLDRAIRPRHVMGAAVSLKRIRVVVSAWPTSLAVALTLLLAFPAAAVPGDPDPDPCERSNPPPDCSTGNPVGTLTSVTRTPAGLAVTGTATDPDDPGPATVEVEVEGLPVGQVTANGPGGGFSGTVPPLPGDHVCVWALNTGDGADTLLGCRSVTVRVDPVGQVDQVTVTSNGLRVQGWALDPDTAGPVTVRVSVDGTPRTTGVADKPRPELATRFPGYGDLHGFDITVPGPRRHTTVCGFAVGVGPGGGTNLGCGRDPRAISLLDLNIKGLQEWWTKDDETDGWLHLPWRDRYQRIAAWLADTSTVPDLIALQEVPARKFHTLGGRLDPYDYEALFVLVTALRQATKAPYRIAFLAADETTEGLPDPGVLYQGRAVLYNADRLRNTTTLVNGRAASHDNHTRVGPHLRTSFPCQAVPAEARPLCALIDSTDASDHEGRHWTSAFTDPITGRWYRGPQAAVFELRAEPGKQVILIDEHAVARCRHDVPKPPPCLAPEREELLALRALVATLNAAWAPHTLLVPPLIVGDFNGEADMPTADLTGEYEPIFTDFTEPAKATTGLDKLLVGDPATYASTYNPRVESQEFPTITPHDGTGTEREYCGTVATMLSDHCALYAQLLPDG